MDFIGFKRPSDVVSSMNPDFIGEEGQSLMTLILALGSHGSVPLSLDGLWKGENGKQQKTTQNHRVLHTPERNHGEDSLVRLVGREEETAWYGRALTSVKLAIV
jgi:hypothetical protein